MAIKKKNQKKSDSYFLRICGSQMGIFWEYFGNILRTLRSRAGTLERVVKYDQEAFSKAWDYLASSPSDGEDD